MVTSADLRSFTTPGAQDAAARTYASVKAALDASTALSRLNLDVFLQGSYANKTNTRGDSDVDIVVMMRSSFRSDISRLSVAEKARYESRRSPSMSSVADLRRLVMSALERHYGVTRVHERNKCIRVDKRDGYVDADVVPALQQRVYTRFPAYGEPEFIEGISIEPLTGGRIINFPKRHVLNGGAKNAECRDRYKPTVRQIKRLRRRAVDLGLLGKKDAPGYLLECMIFNSPVATFGYDDADRVRSVLGWLGRMSAASLAANIRSCDNIYWLFQDDPGAHDEHTAARVIRVLNGMV